MFLFSRPSAAAIARFIAQARATSLSYAPIGIARQRSVPGFQIDETGAIVGYGEADFVRARNALRAWRHLQLGWVELFPGASSIETGTTIAVLARHFGFWSLNACRIVYSVEESTGAHSTFGFAYGTLADHAERGEEIFQVRFEARTGDVVYTVRAASHPRALVAQIAAPMARALQTRFRRESCAALRHAIASR